MRPSRNDNKAGQPAEGRSKRRPYTCFLPIRVGTGFRKPISNLMIHVPSVGVHEILPVHDPGSVIDPVEANEAEAAKERQQTATDKAVPASRFRRENSRSLKSGICRIRAFAERQSRN